MVTARPDEQRTRKLDAETVQALSDGIRGAVLQQGAAGYDESRAVWNGMHDRYPMLVIRPSGVADVVTAVNFARENELTLSIKGGGHNFAGNSVADGSLLLDMSSMCSVHVDPWQQTAYVEGGAQWGDFDHETSHFNLTATGGVVSTTGVAGLTLGGGIGWLNRKLGTSCDNVLAYDVVLADGRYVRASADEHPDLYWALRGGGGNFGVVTGFLFQLHPFDHQVLAGARIYPMDQTRDVLDFYRDFTSSNSRDSVVYALVHMNRETGTNACGIAFCHSGDADQAEQEMAPIRQFGEADLDIIQPMPYPAWQQALDPFFPHGRNYYTKSLLFSELSDEVLDIVARRGALKPNATSVIAFEQYGGAYGDTPKSDTAFWHRDARYQIVVGGGSDDPAEVEACIQWVRDSHDALAPYAMTGPFLNFDTLDEGEKFDRVRAGFGDNWDRLVEIKTRYDPTNFFRVNKNIPPAT